MKSETIDDVKPGRIFLGTAAVMAAIGTALTVWVDPGAITMAAAGYVGMVITAVCMAAVKIYDRVKEGKR